HRGTVNTEKAPAPQGKAIAFLPGLFLLCVLPLCSLCPCGSFCFSAPPPVAVVNGEPIPLAELEAALAQRPPIVTPLTVAQQRELQQEALTALIDERLIRQFLAKNVPP